MIVVLVNKNDAQQNRSDGQKVFEDATDCDFVLFGKGSISHPLAGNLGFSFMLLFILLSACSVLKIISPTATFL